MRKAAAYLGLWVLMSALHHDFWWWNDARLVFGFLPVGLASQAAYTLLAAVVMGCLVRFDWPAELEQLEAASDDAGGEREA